MDCNDSNDEKLRKDIKDLTNALDLIMNLRPRVSKWKYENCRGSCEKADFIAQEVQQVKPEWIEKGFANFFEVREGNLDKNDILTARLDDLQAYIVAAIQELKIEIDKLKGVK